MKKNKDMVSVFGSSKPSPGDLLYMEAFKLGKLLAEQGYGVINGGYIGTMEAVSEGVHSMNGSVIGVSCDEIEAYRPVAPNNWINQEIRCKTLSERIQVMVHNCTAAIALPGGVGTALEVFSMWNQIQIGAQPVKPLLVVGEEWNQMLNEYLSIFQELVHDEAKSIVHPVLNIEEAVELLINFDRHSMS